MLGSAYTDYEVIESALVRTSPIGYWLMYLSEAASSFCAQGTLAMCTGTYALLISVSRCTTFDNALLTDRIVMFRDCHETRSSVVTIVAVVLLSWDDCHARGMGAYIIAHLVVWDWASYFAAAVGRCNSIALKSATAHNLCVWFRCGCVVLRSLFRGPPCHGHDVPTEASLPPRGRLRARISGMVQPDDFTVSPDNQRARKDRARGPGQ